MMAKLSTKSLMKKAAGRSITCRMEGDKLVIHTYHDNKVVQRMTSPMAGSFQFQAVDKED